MQLSDEQIKKLTEKLKKFPHKNCPYCDEGLQLNSTVFELREFMGGDLKVGSSTKLFPVIALACSKCGHTNFFSAVLLGIFNESEDD